MRQKLKKMMLENIDQRMPKITHSGRPSNGWIKTIRTAIGMSQKQLANRLGIKMQSVSHLEMNEIDYSITLKSLKKAANSLECELHYFIVPKNGSSLKKIIKKQATIKATEIIQSVDHSMHLESQRVPNNSKKIKELTDELMEETSTALWD